MNMNYLKFRLKKWFGYVTGITAKRYCKAVFCEITNRVMCENDDDYCYCEKYLKDIKVHFNHNKIIFEVVIFRPGIFIGKAGKNIEAIKTKITERTGLNSEIIIKEWKNPYEFDSILYSFDFIEKISK